MVKNNHCKFFIYLAGAIQKSNTLSAKKEWGREEIDQLDHLFQQRNITVQFLNPSSRSDDLSDNFSVFGRDLLQVYLSDFVLADVREKRGVGVGYEFAWANSKNIPVISWAEKESHYRKSVLTMLGQDLSNWVHPFISQASHCIVDTLSEAAEHIANYKNLSKINISPNDYPLRAIQHYLKKELSNDREMQEIIQKNGELKNSIRLILST